MTTVSSPTTSSLSSPHPSQTSNTLSAHLDSQIARLNAQIASLHQERQNLSRALLASSTVQNIVKSRKSSKPDDGGLGGNHTYRGLEEAVAKQQARNDITFHRLMNNVTTFPFTDPAPDKIRNGEANMFGLRFKMPCTPLLDSQSSSGQHSSTHTDVDADGVFLVVLRRIQRDRKTYLHYQPEMNQIPKHIDVEGFAAQYLPVPDINDEDNRPSPSAHESESYQDDSGIDVTQDLTHFVTGTNGQANSLPTQTQNPNQPVNMHNTNQSLPLFATKTRNALLSWHYRTSHITLLIRNLTLSSSPPTYAHSITTIQPDPPATKLTIDWVNGATAVLGINDDGYVEIARVFGPKMGVDDEEVGVEDGIGTFRCHGVERALEGARLRELAARLEEVGRGMGVAE